MAKNIGTTHRIAMLLSVLAVMVLVPASTAFGQGPGTVGVLVEFPGGDVRPFCVQVDTPADKVAPLLATGLDVATYDFGALGVSVCAIEGLGCPATSADCLTCECTFLPGEPCFFWLYFRWSQANHRWDLTYDPTVQDGDVIAFVWGGTDSATFDPIDTPSLEDVTLAEVCEMQRPREFVPEPGSMLLMGSGLAGLAGYASLKLRASKQEVA
ncbi:MAG TPA: PEP-CTERM sorting domain-containing protein [Anaerolineae bacterium]|nr:PEP-CTERM sorting domain-containing protein [Anaerolineae bacterium]